MATRPKAEPAEVVVERVRVCCTLILANLQHSGLTQIELEDQQDFWQGKLTTAEERLYALRNK